MPHASKAAREQRMIEAQLREFAPAMTAARAQTMLSLAGPDRKRRGSGDGAMGEDKDSEDPGEAGKRFQDILAAAAFMLLLLMCLFCCTIAGVVSHWFGPAWGLLASVAAVAFWVRVGPPAMPGFLPGCLAMMVLIFNGMWGLVAAAHLVQRLVHPAA